jgi:hypothetical protein
MTYDQAKKILDRVKAGVFYPREIVDRALRLTGDLDDHETDGGDKIDGVIYETYQNIAHKNRIARDF